MADRIFPVLQPEDYPAFQKLVPGLPTAHDIWNARHVQELRDAMRQGDRLIEVVVYPGAFAEFLRAQGSDGSLTTLQIFAEAAARLGSP
jgi:hypothetical protein